MSGWGAGGRGMEREGNGCFYEYDSETHVLCFTGNVHFVLGPLTPV